MTDITVAYNDAYTSFTVNFHFQPNDFFTNSVLSKTYVIAPDLIDDSPEIEDISAAEIDWKPSKNLCMKQIQKKMKAKSGKNKGHVKTITTNEYTPSFFHYFGKPSSEDEEDDEDEDKKEHNSFQLSMHADCEIGMAFREDIVPNAIKWFTGEAVQDDFDYPEYDEDDDEDNEGSDDEDDDDDDEEDRKPTKGGKGGRKAPGAGFAAGGGAPAGPDGKPQECKQN